MDPGERARRAARLSPFGHKIPRRAAGRLRLHRMPRGRGADGRSRDEREQSTASATGEEAARQRSEAGSRPQTPEAGLEDQVDRLCLKHKITNPTRPPGPPPLR